MQRAIFRQLDDQEGLVEMLGRLGFALLITGDYTRAVPLFEECLDWTRNARHFWLMAWHLKQLGWAAYEQGDYAKAKPLHEESLALFLELGDKRNVAWALSQTSSVALYQNDWERAISLSEDGLALFRELEDKSGIARALGTLGWVALQQNAIERAISLFEQSLEIYCQLGDKRDIAYLIEAFAAACARAPQVVIAAQRTARLFGAAAALRDAIGVRLPPSDRSLYEPYLAAAHAQLDEAAFSAAWAEGEVLALDEAISEALNHSGSEPAEIAARGVASADSHFQRLSGSAVVVDRA